MQKWKNTHKYMAGHFPRLVQAYIECENESTNWFVSFFFVGMGGG
jgi:hypothetical protein